MSAVLPIPQRRAAQNWRVGSGSVVEVYREPEALRAFVPQWEALAAEAAEPNPFYEHWMLLPALEAYGAEGFECAAVWKNGKLVGLFPMRAERRYRGLPVRVLSSWRHRNMLAAAPLVHAREAADCIASLLYCRPAPVIEFDYTCAGGAFHAALTEALSACGHPWLVTRAYARAVLTRERDPRPRFSGSMRSNLRRWEARLRAAGTLTSVRLGPQDDPAFWLREFMELEASGWKGRAGSALSCRDDDRRFVETVFPEAFRRGRLIVTGLDLNGRPLARHTILTAGDGGFTFKIAYDETYARAAPGIVAEADNVRQFFEHPGPSWIDSNTSAESRNYGRVWKEHRTFQRIAVGLGGLGATVVALQPLLRLSKRLLSRRPRDDRHASDASGGPIPVPPV